MRILGIDYGDARTGLSVSDATGLLAGTPSVIREWNYDRLLDRLTEYIAAEKIEAIVLGYPKNMDGSVGARAEKCEALARDLERRTTVAAHAILHAAGKKEKKHRQNVDAVAASLILQNYLDWRGSQKD